MLNSSNITRSHLPTLRPEFKHLVTKSTSAQGMQKLLDDFEFDSILDVGSGQGLHADIFHANGKTVTAIDFGNSYYYHKKEQTKKPYQQLTGDFNTYEFAQQFDALWCSHILEHQLNPNLFLRKLHGLIKEGGVLAITVPPLKHEIVGGHVSLWNAGLIMYHLVMAGFNCREVSILQYGYNISVILTKKSVNLPHDLSYDVGDLEKLSSFFPDFVKQSFNGDIYEFNWV